MSISKRDEYWYEQALMLARTSTCKFMHGTIIIRNGKPIAYGVNIPCFRSVREFTSGIPRDIHAENRRRRNETTHAEVRALLNSPRGKLEGSILYSARFTKRNTEGPSCPCISCKQIIFAAARFPGKGIKAVVYFDGVDLVKVSPEELYYG